MWTCTFGPFSSLLTTPASAVAARNGFAFIEGAGGAPSVFTAPANEQAHNVFDVSLPIEDEMVPFANWVASLPASQRPKTAAYPMADDPFADPPVQLTQKAAAEGRGQDGVLARSSRPRCLTTLRQLTTLPPARPTWWCSAPPMCRRSAPS